MLFNEYLYKDIGALILYELSLAKAKSARNYSSHFKTVEKLLFFQLKRRVHRKIPIKETTVSKHVM